ncbi:MAG: hypothetical protein EOS58_09745 [Mesorhizobium sp.]|nr:hypothetical protein EN745_06100 [Mesorhizobium sp. M4A.F.Ca.ET.022.05.2.1]RVD70595.1 hypothetical protein EN751_19890 [Mesorhizobium sp. M4A.F.Ca.ET.029.04.2.1]RWD05944.1 MAG: hypothetical protein EOS58_09745 [Mesorhizobium sp.]RWD27315.1 MAG: hypothetical protein EOS22_13870 [Mesorhizobium sp.]TIW33536.1 MAG: hypothetical protein E5V62_20115 [Mesorhizobium sp.]
MEAACRTFLWSILVLCLSICQAAMAQTAPFTPGQIWTYHGAAPASSRVIVGAVDTFAGKGQPIVSISVTDVPIPTNEKEMQTVAHLPVAVDALRASVVELEGTGSVPDGFESGYRQWRQAYDSGKAGYFTISVEGIVRILRTQFDQRTTGQQPEMK